MKTVHVLIKNYFETLRSDIWGFLHIMFIFYTAPVSNTMTELRVSVSFPKGTAPWHPICQEVLQAPNRTKFAGMFSHCRPYRSIPDNKLMIFIPGAKNLPHYGELT